MSLHMIPYTTDIVNYGWSCRCVGDQFGGGPADQEVTIHRHKGAVHPLALANRGPPYGLHRGCDEGLLPLPRSLLPTPLHCRSSEATLHRGSLSGELHPPQQRPAPRSNVFLLSLPLAATEGGAGARARAGGRNQARGALKFLLVVAVTNG